MQKSPTFNVEQDLIRSAQSGEQRAYKQLYDLHAAPLYRFLRFYSSGSGETEEWVQRAFIKAFTNLASFRGDARFSSWLFRIGINEIQMDRRRIQTDLSSETDMPDETAESEAQQFEWHETMTEWLRHIDRKHAMVFVLYEVEGYSHAEIGAMLEIGESTSRTILTRVKKYLRQQWVKEMTA